MGKPKKFDRAQHHKTHARQRAEERYNVRCTTMEFEDLRAQIVQGRATLVDDQVIKGIYKVKLRGQDAYVVYHRITRKIITFLPKYAGQLWNGTHSDVNKDKLRDLPTRAHRTGGPDVQPPDGPGQDQGVEDPLLHPVPHPDPGLRLVPPEPAGRPGAPGDEDDDRGRGDLDAKSN